MAFKDPGEDLTIQQEAGLPDNWVAVNEAAIRPGQGNPGAMPAPPNQSPYFQTNLSPDFQHDTTFTGTEYGSPHIPKTALMPMGIQGSPLTNAAVTSTIKQTAVISAGPDVDTVVTDGLVHPTSPPPWWADPSFFYFVDDFVNWEGSGPFTDTINTSKGQVSRGWTFFGNNSITGNDAPRLLGGTPPFMGQLTHGNSASANQFSGIALNHIDGSVNHFEQCWALLENPGWIATWIFKIAGEPLINASVGSDSITAQNKKAIYIGLAGSTSASLLSTVVGARPNIFIGLRYDTSRMPASMQITSVANASAGSTVYTGTFGSGSWTGQNITVTGCTNAANNGTFACTANSTTTLTLTNASGVAETTVAQNAVANPTSIPLTSVSATSGGTTVYNYTAPPGSGTPTNQLVGLSFVITGFTNAANNGTFTCVANSTTSMTLINNAGIAETHAGFATGGTIGDAFWTFEAVTNRQYSTSANALAQGQTQVTTLPISAGGFHRLDIICSQAGQVKLILDGSGTNQVTFTISTVKIDTSGGNSTVRATGQTAQVNFVVSPASLAGTNGSYPPFGAGSSVTWAGFTAPYLNLNGTFILDNQIDVSGSPSLYFPVANNGGQNTIGGYTATGFPAYTPIATWGNDNSATPQTCFRIYIDFFGICWGKGMAGAPTTTSVTNPRY